MCISFTQAGPLVFPVVGKLVVFICTYINVVFKALGVTTVHACPYLTSSLKAKSSVRNKPKLKQSQNKGGTNKQMTHPTCTRGLNKVLCVGTSN